MKHAIKMIDALIEMKERDVIASLPKHLKEMAAEELADYKAAKEVLVLESKVGVKDSAEGEDPKQRIQRIAIYFGNKLPMISSWSNDILDYILNRSANPDTEEKLKMWR